MKVKKDIRQQLTSSLSATLDGLYGSLSPKKRKRNIKKASKALVAGLKLKVEKTTPQKTKKKKGSGQDEKPAGSIDE